VLGKYPDRIKRGRPNLARKCYNPVKGQGFISLKFMENTPSREKNLCDCIHHQIIPVLIMVFGGLFLLLRFYIITEELVSLVWPILVIGAGAVKFRERTCRCC